jgi:Questin oxidase-like
VKDATAETSNALDEAFERLAFAGFELPNGFVNHGAMACEALAALGFEEELDGWARRFARAGGPCVEPVLASTFEWGEALGDYRRLPEWLGHFTAQIDDEGWSDVVETWVPRLMPSLATALFHGAIRTGHAVRAISTADTEARRQELARALGYWAARFRPGQAAGQPPEVADVKAAVVAAAAAGAGYFVAEPNIFHLHGVTGAMAVELLAPHIAHEAAAAGLAQVQAEHMALYPRARPAAAAQPAGAPSRALAVAAEASLDPHQVKLVEACRRGLELSGDPVFAAAAETVTGVSSETA